MVPRLVNSSSSNDVIPRLVSSCSSNDVLTRLVSSSSSSNDVVPRLVNSSSTNSRRCGTKSSYSEQPIRMRSCSQQFSRRTLCSEQLIVGERASQSQRKKQNKTSVRATKKEKPAKDQDIMPKENETVERPRSMDRQTYYYYYYCYYIRQYI